MKYIDENNNVWDLNKENPNAFNPYLRPKTCHGRSVLHSTPTVCYNEKKTKGDYSMSLVGIMKNKNGMVAFGDEKSSFMVGSIPYTAKPAKVQKVFQGKDFLFVAHGPNQIPGRPNLNLEDIIKEVGPENYSDYKEFFQRLWERISETNALHYVTYHFIVGYPDRYIFEGKRNGNYGISNCNFDKYQVNYTNSYYQDDVIIAGEERFEPQFIQVRQDWTLEEMKAYCEKLVESSIFFSTMTFKENSVIDGKPVIKTYVDPTL